MKKILIVVPYDIFPPYAGQLSRNYNLAKNIAKNNKIWLLVNKYKQIEKHTIDCDEYRELYSNPNVQIQFVKSYGKFSQMFNPFLIIAALKIIKNERPDYLFAESLWSGFHVRLLNFLYHIPYILDEHNVEFLRFRRIKRGNSIIRYLLKIYEKVSCNFAYKVFCVSAVDRDFLISKLDVPKKKLLIVPNGVNNEKFFPDDKKAIETRNKLKLDKNPLILFFGKLDNLPNYEAVKIIQSEILPRVLRKIPNARFLIVGDNPPKSVHHENMIFTGLVEKIEDFINASDVVIAPLLSGGGTRLKIVEAFACGKIVISTSIGAEGLAQEVGNDFLKIHDNWDEFSEQIVISLSKKFSQINKEFINRYSWNHISLSFSKIFEEPLN